MKKLVFVLMALMTIGMYSSCGHQTQASTENDTTIVDTVDTVGCDTVDIM